jgi:hypothetical protein
VQNIKVYGTDGDYQLSGAFNLVYPIAYHLPCDIHVNTIFGVKVNEKHLKGLVYSESEVVFDKRSGELLSDLLRMGEKEVKFGNHFLAHKAQKRKHRMRSDISEIVGLGYPPVGYNQNPNEGSNRAIKRQVKEKCTIVQFIDIFDEILVDKTIK